MNIIENRSVTMFPEFRRIAAREGDCRRQEQGISCPPQDILVYVHASILCVTHCGRPFRWGIETSTQTLSREAPLGLVTVIDDRDVRLNTTLLQP